MARQRGFIAAAAAIGLLLPAESLADTERIALGYEAFAGCPKRGEFEARVLAITQKAEFAESGPRKFSVRLEPDKTGVVGRLEIVSEAESGTREVRGKSCDEVASALALVTALAVDPNALGGEPSSDSKREPKTSPKTAAEAAGPGTVDVGSRAVTPVRALVLSAGAGAGMTSGIAPEPLHEGRLFVELAFGGSWVPAVRGTFEYSPSRNLETGETRARFGAMGGALDLSLAPLSFRDLTFALVAGAELENVEAAALDVPLSRVANRLWFALLGGARITWEIPGLNYHSLRPGFFAELQGAAIFPLIEQEYFVATPFREASFVHKNPHLCWTASLALGLRFL